MPGSGRAQGPSPTTLSEVIKQFKTLTTRRYIEGVRPYGWHSFSGKLWQRSYHDHIIRKGTELNKIRTYICNNPIEWEGRVRDTHLWARPDRKGCFISQSKSKRTLRVRPEYH
ncbi:MAG: transposase [Phycisphaeraceae bacterium]|nr:transposase [Phycisphaeraceae bacterium]